MALVAVNRKMITRFEKKIQATRARVWGAEAPPATEATVTEVVPKAAIPKPTRSAGLQVQH